MRRYFNFRSRWQRYQNAAIKMLVLCKSIRATGILDRSCLSSLVCQHCIKLQRLQSPRPNVSIPLREISTSSLLCLWMINALQEMGRLWGISVIHTNTCTQAHTGTHMHGYMHARTYACKHACMHVCTHTRARIHI